MFDETAQELRSPVGPFGFAPAAMKR